MKFKTGKFFSIFLIVAASLGIFTGLAFLIYDSIMASMTKKSDSRLFSEVSIQAEPVSEKSVLVISSYNSLHPVTTLELQGISESFSNNNISFDVEYMDSTSYPSLENQEYFYEYLKFKMSNHKNYDAVVFFNDPALNFAMQYHDELFRDKLLFFSDVVNSERAQTAKEKFNISGIVETNTFSDTIRLALNFIPHAKKIYALSDNSEEGRGLTKKLIYEKAKFINLDLEIINASNLTTNEIAEKLKSIDKNSIFLFLFLTEDRSGKVYSLSESFSFIQKYASEIPVFRQSYGGIGTGIFGGTVYDFRQSGNLSGEIISQALQNNININEFGLISDLSWYSFVDYSLCKKFGFDEKLIPSASTLVNDEVDRYKAIFIPFIMISVSLLILLGISSTYYIKANRAQVLVKLRNNAIGRKNKLLKESEEKLKRMSQHDYLTEIPNRFYADEKLNSYFENKIPFTLFHMDIDSFKNYNDYYTHDCGDFVLKDFSRRLLDISSKIDCFVARYGGDEFLLIYENGYLENNSEEFNLIKSILNQPCMYRNMKLDVSASCGVANYEEGSTFDEILSNADIAMYEAKKRGKGNIFFFRSEMKDEINEKNKIAKILDEECKNKGFEIMYQPQIDTLTGMIHGYEALVRLENYQVSPAQFIPVAEEGGYITSIGRIVTEKVISQMAAWRDDGMELKKVAINYSMGQLVDLDYVDFLDNLLKIYDISPSLIEIEITESLFMENKKLAKRLFESLAKIGVNLALDDFGTGFSSLSYLTYLPVKKVKIDKSLVDNYLVDGKDNFIKNIARLVHDLGMELTVEGVEKQWQYEKLKQLNCDYIQGYYFCKPISGMDVEKFSASVIAG